MKDSKTKNTVTLSTNKDVAINKKDKIIYQGTMQESALIIAMSKVKFQDHLNNWSYSKLLELLKLHCCIMSYNFPAIVVENICAILHRSFFFFLLF